MGPVEITERRSNDAERDSGSKHLDEREGDGVVARGVALHQDDLQGVDGGGCQHQKVAGHRAGMDARKHREPDRRQRNSSPHRQADARPDEDEGDQRRQDDVHPGDEARARDGRPLEPSRLQRVPGGQQQAEERPAHESRPPEAPDAREAGNGQRQRRDAEAHRQEGEQRIERDGVLDLDERHAPNGGDEDQGEESRHRAILRQTLGLSSVHGTARRRVGPGDQVGSHLGHRQVQLPLHLLHAGRRAASGSAATRS